MIEGIEIRRATPDDLLAVAELLEAQFREHAIPISRPDLEFAAEGLLRIPERGAVIAAFHQGTMVGVACLAYTWTLEHGGAVAWLDETYVLPAMRGRGIGGELLGEAVATAYAAGCLALDLEVDASHARAEHLYERHGFRPLRRRRWSRPLP